ncbi:MAG: sulfatase-like hydrolase/transferase [Verrucomicrobiales bacterium]|nr:sulfatase-like hydrolase/transferase [Verrucomicrobiales bacterium]
MKLLIPFAVIAVFFSFSISLADERPSQPNILLLLTDDLGWQDVGCYDIDEPSPMETPNIDALAKKGVMFWQGYSPAPTCAPSRCAIMSGVHPARAQKTHVVGGAPPAPRSKHARMMDPWYSGRMPEDELTLAKVLRENGYATGHSGKWHMAIDHHAFPQPGDQGFDWTRADRGARTSMKDRLDGFATEAKEDPFRLDENGFPFHQTNEDALTFLREQEDKPFFLYYATWLVHSPMHTRSKELLEKYVKKLGVDPGDVATRETEGQINPFYCAMVEELDYYVGQVFNYLENTDDPRWPGHKLIENTYVIFTSDNGGMEGGPKERYTDNYPLDRGKISAMEGGTRVPFIITGPGIEPGQQSDVMVNGLDFYPTILSWAGIGRPAAKALDGCDLSLLLKENPTDPSLLKDVDGNVRDTMVWHFPHGVALESTIRRGDFKLVRNYDHVGNPETVPLELYQLYETTNGVAKRVDIEESKNLVESLPELASELNGILSESLAEMQASYPYYSPDSLAELSHQENVPEVVSHRQEDDLVTFRIEDAGAMPVRADLIFTSNPGDRYEEWFRGPATLQNDLAVTATLPPSATHYYLNVVDENGFLRSYPEVERKDDSFAGSAISVATGEIANPPQPEAEPTPKTDRHRAFLRLDADGNGAMTRTEYKEGMKPSPDLDERFDRFDQDANGELSRDEFVHPGKR